MRILIVDDEPAIRFALADLLASAGHDVREAEHAPAALAALDDAPADLVITDQRMPKVSGLELLERLRAFHPRTLVVLMTAHGDERLAVRALKEGAWHYVPKPFDNDEVRAVVARAAELVSLREENERLRAELSGAGSASGARGGMVGASPAMRALARTIERVAPTEATILIAGESGTGKELVARALHDASARRRGPFVAVNCSALPGELVESELFGVVKGAFTGADRDREGLFQAAGGGTLFLDELGDMSLAAQAKLLRVLESREVTRVGSTKAIRVDARVVAATHRPLAAMAREGRFREDLLFRLQVVTLEIPPLRERREDIVPLALHFAAASAAAHGVPPRTLGDAARRALLAHDWPGNVRELRNAIERAVLLAEGETIEPVDLPPAVRETAFRGGALDLRAPFRPAEAALADLPFAEARDEAVRAFETAFLRAALERHGGNVSRAARALGMHRQSLQKMLARLGLRGNE